MRESATASIVGVPSGPGSCQYTVTLTNTGTASIGSFWFAWDDVPEPHFMNQNPTITEAPAGWTVRTTTESYLGGTGYGIQWYALDNASRLAARSVTSTFKFTSTLTPAELSTVSPFDPTFRTTSSFVYRTASFAPAAGDSGAHLEGDVACFRLGTNISTADGEVPVEMLSPGDFLLTERGKVRPLRWIGRRHIWCDRHPNPDQAWPVCVTRGALGPSIPHTDLYLSPDHALYSDGVLIPVKHLINGTTITRVPVDDVIYYHLELSSHDVILAEGAPAETYLDTGDRAKFESKITVLFPEAAIPGRPLTERAASTDMEFVAAGPVLTAIRRRLAARARSVTKSSRAGKAA